MNCTHREMINRKLFPGVCVLLTYRRAYPDGVLDHKEVNEKSWTWRPDKFEIIDSPSFLLIDCFNIVFMHSSLSRKVSFCRHSDRRSVSNCATDLSFRLVLLADYLPTRGLRLANICFNEL